MAIVKKRYVALGMMLALHASADSAYLQASCELDYPEAIAHLQDAIGKAGYTVSRIQHVDNGLLERGYQSDKYKVVFFGKPEQMAEVIERHPAMIPFVPLNFTVSRQGKQVLVSSLAPSQLSQLGVSADAEKLVARWQRDVEAIVRRYATCQVD